MLYHQGKQTITLPCEPSRRLTGKLVKTCTTCRDMETGLHHGHNGNRLSLKPVKVVVEKAVAELMRVADRKVFAPTFDSDRI